MSDKPQKRTRVQLIEQWRSEARWKAYGYIAASKAQMVSNRALAEILQMDPRGLRGVIERDPHFIVEIRHGAWGRGEPWYSINHTIKHGPDQPPKLIRMVTNPARNSDAVAKIAKEADDCEK